MKIHVGAVCSPTDAVFLFSHCPIYFLGKLVLLSFSHYIASHSACLRIFTFTKTLYTRSRWDRLPHKPTLLRYFVDKEEVSIMKAFVEGRHSYLVSSVKHKTIVRDSRGIVQELNLVEGNDHLQINEHPRST